MAIAYVLANYQCWAEFEAGWSLVDWSSSACRYRTFDEGKFIVFEYFGQVTGSTRLGYYPQPWYCATASRLPVDATTTWTFGAQGYTSCTYWMRRLQNAGSAQPDFVQVTTWTTGIVCTDWCDHQTAWIYLPVTGQQPVSFVFAGISWTYDRQISTCECNPSWYPDPGEGF